MRTGCARPLAGWQPGDPTPEEIEEQTRMIRSTWSVREYFKRAGLKVPLKLANEHDYAAGMVQETPIPMGRFVGIG